MKLKIIFFLFILSYHLKGQYSYNSNRYKTFTNFEEAIQNPKNVFHLDLSRQSLKEVPKEITRFSNLETLNLDYNNLKNIDIDFSFFPKLKTLNLNNNNLTNLPFESLSHCTELQLLGLRNNKFEEVTKEWNQLKYLEILDIGGNLLSNVSEELELKYLHTFKADDNELQHFPIGLENSPKLKLLNLNRNAFKTIPSTFKNLQSLERLDLGNNDLEGISSIQHLSRLKTLILDWTNLSDEDISGITRLKHLRILSLEHCQHQSTSRKFGNLKHLQELSLIFNELESMPEEIKKLKHLKRIWIGNNKFTNADYLSCQKLVPNCEVIFQ